VPLDFQVITGTNLEFTVNNSLPISVILYARILGLFGDIYLENVELPNDLKESEPDLF